ncbi:hypothetical protein HYE34_02080 [Mycoplasmopsis bovis]|nr:hypothetical protein HYE34_02080 [Mycoplasmopsis bovis]
MVLIILLQILNNPPKSRVKQKEQKMIPNGSDLILLQILTHKIKINQPQKTKKEPNGSGNSSSNTNPQIQDNIKHHKKIILKKEKNDDPKDLLEQLEKIRRRLWRKQKEKMKT